jgi:hypothetical protein
MEASMSLWIVALIVMGLILLVNLLGNWFDGKTGWILGFIIAGGVSIFLMGSLHQAAEHSYEPNPAQVYCKNVGTC